ncbi:uncharacterized protein N7479_006407 [Penicillium vulpinum]|uniref:Xylanolytic transcriptional activator regulatory domain-containing protein n=1 Tax=Penicillium vulpinum TaxID=29845 RepID=A0A1V6S227_9EURO|nr:uncharacterized protein N7479_006407 [Penicillium vulpinum]KAJ5959257.1 hypothetical protein N7479_006407 [Penicillium vulpinum]OQE08102.1 hypothetical protein PENVUL_c011G00502 [Penicillium vulpinum]
MLTLRSDLLVRHERLSHPGSKEQAAKRGARPSKQPRRSIHTQNQALNGQDLDASVCEPQPLVEIASVEETADHSLEPIYADSSETTGTTLEEIDGSSQTLNQDSSHEQQLNDANILSPSFSTQFQAELTETLLGDSFQDLAAFMDNHTPFSGDFASFISPTQGLDFALANQYNDTGCTTPALGSDLRTVKTQQLTEMDTFSRLGSRLPSLQPEEDIQRVPQMIRTVNLFEGMSTQTRDVLISKVEEFAAVVPESFQMPSRLAMSRYLTAYVKGFHEHMPFLHIPTMSAEGCYIELVLAIASIGGQYCFEPEKTVQLFQISHLIARERIRRQDAISVSHSDHDQVSRRGSCHENCIIQYKENTIQTAQALLLLMAEATWSNHRTIMREALAIQSILATLVRDDGLKTTPLPNNVSWESWATYESTKRTKWIVFCFFNLHTIVYNIPSPILSSDVDGMLLPCHIASFRATSEDKWRNLKENEYRIWFKDAFSQLFQENFTTTHTAPNSTLGNYILAHALIQHIYLVREVYRHRRRDIPEEDIACIELALRNWKSMWKHTPDSSIDPSNPAGPVSFNSTALLRIAYIRIHADIGPGRALHTRDPIQVSNAFLNAQIISRTPRLLRAVLHAAHALSIPIRIGVHLVAQTQTFRWSIQHSLATLECAFLLSKWLEALSSPAAIQTITPDEHRMVMLVKTMLDETDFAVPLTFTVGSPAEMKLLSANVLRVWAKVFHGPAQVWAIVDIVRVSLELCADLVENV